MTQNTNPSTTTKEKKKKKKKSKQLKQDKSNPYRTATNTVCIKTEELQ